MLTNCEFDDSFNGSGFSYSDEYDDDFSQSEDIYEYEDDSVQDFEDDAMYDEAFENEPLEFVDSIVEPPVHDNGFNDSLDDL